LFSKSAAGKTQLKELSLVLKSEQTHNLTDVSGTKVMKGMLCETVGGMLLQATDTSPVPHPQCLHNRKI